jgi:hypothetical protein
MSIPFRVAPKAVLLIAPGVAQASYVDGAAAMFVLFFAVPIALFVLLLTWGLHSAGSFDSENARYSFRLGAFILAIVPVALVSGVGDEASSSILLVFSGLFLGAVFWLTRQNSDKTGEKDVEQTGRDDG